MNVALTLVSSEQFKTLESNLEFLHNWCYSPLYFLRRRDKILKQYA